jgi:hypothetical protein
MWHLSKHLSSYNTSHYVARNCMVTTHPEVLSEEEEEEDIL